ncbi:MAG: AAA family ATPase [Myxococcales bacterium]|nr:AAA family ATPase [Myxococcales bacterium]
MRLTSLSLTDFRGFASLDLTFEPDVTVLVGVNGAGKTSILDAIAMMLSQVHALHREGAWTDAHPRRRDVRLGATVARVTVGVSQGNETGSWTATSDPSASIQGAIPAKSGSPPLALYFPTNRSALDIPSRIHASEDETAFDAFAAYDGALEDGASNFRGFFEWYRREEDLENEERLRPPADGVLHARLSFVREAIERLFPGGKSLRIERRPQRMVIERGGETLDVSQLSDGEKCLVAMAGDLARRMVQIAPDDPAPLEREVIVLVDELELHLHPGLQRQILGRLRAAFPNAQLVVSTHSPQVLSSVHRRSVRLLEGFAQKPLDAGTWKRDTNSILESAFGDSGRPSEVATKIIALQRAVDADDFAKARTLVAELRDEVEGFDPEVELQAGFIPPEEEPTGEETAS